MKISRGLYTTSAWHFFLLDNRTDISFCGLISFFLECPLMAVSLCLSNCTRFLALMRRRSSAQLRRITCANALSWYGTATRYSYHVARALQSNICLSDLAHHTTTACSSNKADLKERSRAYQCTRRFPAEHKDSGWSSCYGTRIFMYAFVAGCPNAKNVTSRIVIRNCWGESAYSLFFFSAD